MSTPIDQLLAKYAAEHSDFSGEEGLAFAIYLARRYAEGGPDCQNRCVVHTLLQEIDRQRAYISEIEVWQQRGEAIIAAKSGWLFAIAEWWADRPWRRK